MTNVVEILDGIMGSSKALMNGTLQLKSCL